MYKEGSVAGVFGRPPAHVARRWVLKTPATEHPLVHVCIEKMAYGAPVSLLQNPVLYHFMYHRIISRIEEMLRLLYKAMAAANLSRDVLEMFYGPIEENQKLSPAMRAKKEKQIIKFVKKHGDAPLQRTPEWVFLRGTVIGASELAALAGMSPYGNS